MTRRDFLALGGVSAIVQPPREAPKGIVLSGGINAHQNLGVPQPRYIHDIELVGDGSGYGIHCDASCVVFERVVVRGFYINLVLSNAVHVTFRDCLFTRATGANIYIPPHVVTTVRFDACNIREAPYGVVIQAGMGISFTNRCIIESNTQVGMIVAPSPAAPFFGDILLDRVWFENNPADLIGAEHCTLVDYRDH